MTRRGARTSNVAGKALTPLLLEVLAESNGGATLRTNRALLADNATGCGRGGVLPRSGAGA